MIKLKYFYNILEGQYSTEKAVMLADKYKSITFRVSNKSNKSSIKRVVEELFKVSVSSVKIINVKGKKVRFKNIIGKKKKLEESNSDFKKRLRY